METEQQRQLGILSSPHNMTAKFFADDVTSSWQKTINLHQTKREFNFNLKTVKNYRQNGIFKKFDEGNLEFKKLKRDWV